MIRLGKYLTVFIFVKVLWGLSTNSVLNSNLEYERKPDGNAIKEVKTDYDGLFEPDSFLGLIHKIIIPVEKFLSKFQKKHAFMIQTAANLLGTNPPRKLTKPNFLRHSTIDELNMAIGKSLLSECTQEHRIIEGCLCDKFSDVKVFYNPNYKSTAVVAVDPIQKKIIVSYGYAKYFANWITNVKFRLVPYPNLPIGTRVHAGFLAHFISSATQVNGYVLELLNNSNYVNFNLHITGYSMGAAISLVSAPNWYHLLKTNNCTNQLEVYAYVSPRVGNQYFVNYLAMMNVPITRYTAYNDITSHLPPRNFDYVHAGTEIYQDGDHQLKICDQMYDEDPTCGWSQRFNMSITSHINLIGASKNTNYCN